MKAKLSILLLAVVCCFTFFACSDNDDENVKMITLTLNISEPTNLVDLKLSTWEITFKERNTGKTYTEKTETSTLVISLPQGDYEVTGKNPSTYTFDGITTSTVLYFTQKSLVLTNESTSSTQTSFPQTEYTGTDGGFVIEEIFYTGTQTPEGKQYLGDQYIKLYNNSDKTLYADGLFLAITDRTSSITYTYTPEILDTAVPVSGIIIVPGDGKSYPVAPGKSFVFAASAVNHKESNANSFDMQNADMEWHNEALKNQPADNPNVTNAISFYDSFTLHSQGLNSLIMGRLEVSQDKYLEDYTYEYSWKGIINGKEYERGPFVIYKIPNEWIMDAVYTSVEGKAEKRVMSPSLDLSWTHCGASFGDVERFGKSVIRKVASSVDGRNILQDTNNSSVDFSADSTPSLSK